MQYAKLMQWFDCQYSQDALEELVGPGGNGVAELGLSPRDLLPNWDCSTMPAQAFGFPTTTPQVAY